MNRFLIALAFTLSCSVGSMAATSTGVPTMCSVNECSPIASRAKTAYELYVNFSGTMMFSFVVGGVYFAKTMDNSQGAVSMYKMVTDASAAGKQIRVVYGNETQRCITWAPVNSSPVTWIVPQSIYIP